MQIIRFRKLSTSEKWKEHRSDEYFQYRKMWDEILRNKITTDFPIHLDIETTNICNLKCPMCPRTEMINNETFGEIGRMTQAQYADIIDQAAGHGTKSIKLNYLGEPLAHKDVVWQVEYAKKKGIVDVMMNSNATLLNKERGRALLEAGLDNMFVSFDASSPDLFEQQRVGTSLGKVIDNVYEFVKMRNESFPVGAGSSFDGYVQRTRMAGTVRGNQDYVEAPMGLGRIRLLHRT